MCAEHVYVMIPSKFNLGGGAIGRPRKSVSGQKLLLSVGRRLGDVWFFFYNANMGISPRSEDVFGTLWNISHISKVQRRTQKHVS